MNTQKVPFLKDSVGFRRLPVALQEALRFQGVSMMFYEVARVSEAF